MHSESFEYEQQYAIQHIPILPISPNPYTNEKVVQPKFFQVGFSHRIEKDRLGYIVEDRKFQIYLQNTTTTGWTLLGTIVGYSSAVQKGTTIFTIIVLLNAERQTYEFVCDDADGRQLEWAFRVYSTIYNWYPISNYLHRIRRVYSELTKAIDFRKPDSNIKNALPRIQDAYNVFNMFLNRKGICTDVQAYLNTSSDETKEKYQSQVRAMIDQIDKGIEQIYIDIYLPEEDQITLYITANNIVFKESIWPYMKNATKGSAFERVFTEDIELEYKKIEVIDTNIKTHQRKIQNSTFGTIY